LFLSEKRRKKVKIFFIFYIIKYFSLEFCRSFSSDYLSLKRNENFPSSVILSEAKLWIANGKNRFLTPFRMTIWSFC
jgi:hypothetical protein